MFITLKINHMNEIIPRYEYRIFGLDITENIEKLKKLGKPDQTRNIAEIYLMTAGNSSNNVKIRSRNLDIKKLVCEVEMLEQWKPFNIGLFPLDKNKIKHQVFPALGVEPPVLERENYSLEEFMKELILDDPDIIVALTEKTRYGFLLNDCICEWAEVRINGAMILTLAVESENEAKVLETINMLDAEEFENINYPKAIKRVLGLEINYDLNKYY